MKGSRPAYYGRGPTVAEIAELWLSDGGGGWEDCPNDRCPFCWEPGRYDGSLPCWSCGYSGAEILAKWKRIKRVVDAS